MRLATLPKIITGTLIMFIFIVNTTGSMNYVRSSPALLSCLWQEVIVSKHLEPLYISFSIISFYVLFPMHVQRNKALRQKASITQNPFSDNTKRNAIVVLQIICLLWTMPDKQKKIFGVKWEKEGEREGERSLKSPTKCSLASDSFIRHRVYRLAMVLSHKL